MKEKYVDMILGRFPELSMKFIMYLFFDFFHNSSVLLKTLYLKRYLSECILQQLISELLLHKTRFL